MGLNSSKKRLIAGVIGMLAQENSDLGDQSLVAAVRVDPVGSLSFPTGDLLIAANGVDVKRVIITSKVHGQCNLCHVIPGTSPGLSDHIKVTFHLGRCQSHCFLEGQSTAVGALVVVNDEIRVQFGEQQKQVLDVLVGEHKLVLWPFSLDLYSKHNLAAILWLFGPGVVELVGFLIDSHSPVGG